MAAIRSTFNFAGSLYGEWFGEWLHIHFMIRTVLLLFIVWLLILIFAQLFQYIIGPFLFMFFYHVIFRAWNYLFVETTHEWLYIRYHSKDMPNFSGLYSRLCDRVKKNRKLITEARYDTVRHQARVFATRFMIVCLAAATLWVSAFGLHYEYAPQIAVNGRYGETDAYNEPNEDYHDSDNEAAPGFTDIGDGELSVGVGVYTPGIMNPALWQPGQTIVFALNEIGMEGTRLRDGPGIVGHTVIEILWDDSRLEYLHVFVPDPDVHGLYWLHVRSPAGTEGFISSRLVEIVDSDN